MGLEAMLGRGLAQGTGLKVGSPQYVDSVALSKAMEWTSCPLETQALSLMEHCICSQFNSQEKGPSGPCKQRIEKGRDGIASALKSDCGVQADTQRKSDKNKTHWQQETSHMLVQKFRIPPRR